MSAAAPQDGGSNPENFVDKLRNPFERMKQKFKDSSLHDVKVELIHKK
jgi:phospholipase D1/2